MKRKLVIVGIDGGTFKVINPLIAEGKLPHLEKLINSGVKGILKSTYPPITAAAWVSFMTGKNPGKHGYFDFREYNPAEYDPIDIPFFTIFHKISLFIRFTNNNPVSHSC